MILDAYVGLCVGFLVAQAYTGRHKWIALCLFVVGYTTIKVIAGS